MSRRQLRPSSLAFIGFYVSAQEQNCQPKVAPLCASSSEHPPRFCGLNSVGGVRIEPEQEKDFLPLWDVRRCAMAQVGAAQLRLVYSLLKPVVRAAARFHIPVRTLVDLLRLAYFELLIHSGLTQAQAARRFGQTERHMRSLAQRLRTDFFSAEQEIGLVREIENLVATRSPVEAELRRQFRSLDAEQLDEAIAQLLREERIVRDENGRLTISKRYVLLSSDQFKHRIDALNHFLESVDRALIARLVFDERDEAMMKTISFSALPPELRAFLRRLEGDLRREIAALEENVTFEGGPGQRYTLAISLATLPDDAR
jgi:hypothetical protein